MSPEVINYEDFYKATNKYVGTINSLYKEFIIYHQFSNIVVVDINLLSIGLALYILGKNDICLIVFT